jgi:archaemetzincin
MAPEPILAEVLPLGQVHPVALSVVAAHLQTILDLPARVSPPLPEPEYALMALRQQYDAGLILKALADPGADGRLRLAVTAVDICLPILTYVYGEARLGGLVAVVSLHRLQREPPGGERPPHALVYRRLAKVTLHEAGHALGLTHCPVQGCLMAFSQTQSHLDDLDLSFCPACRQRLAAGRRRLAAGG